MGRHARRQDSRPLRPRLLAAIALILVGAGRTAAQTPPSSGSKESKPERGVAVDGTFRLRYENTRSVSDSGPAEQTRARLKFRVGLLGTIEERFAVGVRLASGSDNPTSGNIDLGEPITGEGTRFDQAFLRYAPAGWTTIWAGRIPNPLVENHLLWDKDICPKGLAQRFAFPLPSGPTVFANLGGFVLAEETGADDPEVWTAQLGTGWFALDDGAWTAAVTYYDYLNLGETVLPHGRTANSRTASGLLVYDFNILILYAAYRHAGRLPVAVTLETSDNLEAPAGSRGLGAEVQVGRNRRPGDWSVLWAFQRLERDAAPDALTESGWHDQGANYSGHQARVRYSLNAGWHLTASVRVMRAIDGPRDDERQLKLDSTWDF